jgi:hypothetical protein
MTPVKSLRRARPSRSPFRPQRRLPILLTTTAAMLIASVLGALPALASPTEVPTLTYGMNGMVRATAQSGTTVWVAGQFSQVVGNSSAKPLYPGTPGTETNIAAFELDGTPIDVPLELGGTGSIVYDLHVNGSTVYAAGGFGAQGAVNLIAFDGETGQTIQTYSTPPLFSVHRAGGVVYAGGKKLWRVTSATQESVVASPGTNAVGTRTRVPQVVDIATAPQGGLFLACKCDWMNDPETPSKAFVHLLADGTYDETWVPGRSAAEPNGLLEGWGTPQESQAFGWELVATRVRTYLAAGGSDFVLAVDTATGDRDWVTDTSGSAQTVGWFDQVDAADQLIIGGHWTRVDDGDGDHCQPRLAALDPATGALFEDWTPAVNPHYAGAWSVMQASDTALWVGGEFVRVASDWQRQADGSCVLDPNGSPTTAGTNRYQHRIARFPAA